MIEFVMLKSHVFDARWVFLCIVLVDSPHIECVVDVPLDELHCDEVIALAAVVEDQSVLVRGFQLEVGKRQSATTLSITYKYLHLPTLLLM